jgi:hypothetical protein
VTGVNLFGTEFYISSGRGIYDNGVNSALLNLENYCQGTPLPIPILDGTPFPKQEFDVGLPPTAKYTWATECFQSQSIDFIIHQYLNRLLTDTVTSGRSMPQQLDSIVPKI